MVKFQEKYVSLGKHFVALDPPRCVLRKEKPAKTFKMELLQIFAKRFVNRHFLISLFTFSGFPSNRSDALASPYGLHS